MVVPSWRICVCFCGAGTAVTATCGTRSSELRCVAGCRGSTHLEVSGQQGGATTERLPQGNFFYSLSVCAHQLLFFSEFYSNLSALHLSQCCSTRVPNILSGALKETWPFFPPWILAENVLLKKKSPLGQQIKYKNKKSNNKEINDHSQLSNKLLTSFNHMGAPRCCLFHICSVASVWSIFVMLSGDKHPHGALKLTNVWRDAAVLHSAVLSLFGCSCGVIAECQCRGQCYVEECHFCSPAGLKQRCLVKMCDKLWAGDKESFFETGSGRSGRMTSAFLAVKD